jgi:hypothetical protein
VIDAYVERYKKGRKVPQDFKDDIGRWLEDLCQLQNMKAWGHPRTYRYWSIPSYALAHKMKKGTLMKCLRELARIAAHLFPDSVPSSMKKRAPLTPEEKEAIRKRYLAGEDCKILAEEFGIPPSQVGQLCRSEKAIRDENRIRLRDEQPPQLANAAQPTTDDFEDDWDKF